MSFGRRISSSPAITASAAANQNNAGTPNLAATTGPRISATIKDAPMPMPKKAMERVRTSSRVASAISAARRCRNGAGALQEPTRYHAPYGIAESGDDAACCKDRQATDDDRHPAYAVGQRAERDLQARLRQPVSADRETNQNRRRTVEFGRIQRQYRQ